MSRPLTEQGVALTQGRQGFGIRQLQRRPAQGGFSEFGATTQEVFLPEFGDATNSDSNAFAWIGDAASFGGGYVRNSPANDGDYFSFMTLLSPAGSIWSFRYLWWVGPDYGVMKMQMASLGYELGSRTLGCPAGKIQDYAATYGDPLNYMNTGFNNDFYNVAEAQQTGAFGNFQIVVGGELGQPLTDLADANNACADGAGQEPLTTVNVMDGGPGWYRTKLYIDGKNASSTGFKMRVSRIVWMRVDDLFGM